MIAVGAIAVEAIGRIQQPAEVAGRTVVLVAALGVLVNGATALLFMRGRHADLNIRGAYMHMAADAGVSLGVVVAALAIILTGWLWLDPAISLCIAAILLASGWGLARDSVNLALDGVPKGIELAGVRDYLGGLEGVTEVHDLHIWAMSTNETALTAHLVRPGGYDDSFLHGICEELPTGSGSSTRRSRSRRAAMSAGSRRRKSCRRNCRVGKAQHAHHRQKGGHGASALPTLPIPRLPPSIATLRLRCTIPPAPSACPA